MGTARTLAELIGDVAAEHPAKPAIIFQDQPIGYAQLNALIDRAANALAALERPDPGGPVMSQAWVMAWPSPATARRSTSTAAS